MARYEKKRSQEERIGKIRLVFAIIMIVSGMGIMSYPFVSSAIAAKHATVAIQNYAQEVEAMDEEKLDALKEAAKAYNDQLNMVMAQGDEGVSGSTYADILGIGESLAKMIFNPAEYIVGHMERTSYPLGGESTHCVLTGHRGLPEAVLFTDLDQLEKGDKFYLHTLDEVLAYQVDQIKVVLPTETSDLEIIEGMDHCTLLTCTPYGINSHRLLVRGVRCEYTGEEEEAAAIIQYQQLQTGTIVRRLLNIWPWMLMALILIVGVEFGMMVIILRRHRRRREDD